MEYNYRSIESLLSDIEDDFQLTNTDWFYKAIGWIARGLEQIGAWDDLQPCNKTLTVKDYKAILPCDIDYIMYFSRDCFYYRIKSDFSCSCAEGCPNGFTSDERHYVIVNQRYVKTTFDCGTITIHYYSLPTDNNGYPLIIDNAFVTEALSWFVCYKMLTNGYKHSVIKDWREAKREWELAYPRAQNNVNFPSVRDAQRLINSWTLIPKDNNLIQHHFSR